MATSKKSDIYKTPLRMNGTNQSLLMDFVDNRRKGQSVQDSITQTLTNAKSVDNLRKLNKELLEHDETKSDEIRMLKHQAKNLQQALTVSDTARQQLSQQLFIVMGVSLISALVAFFFF